MLIIVNATDNKLKNTDIAVELNCGLEFYLSFSNGKIVKTVNHIADKRMLSFYVERFRKIMRDKK